MDGPAIRNHADGRLQGMTKTILDGERDHQFLHGCDRRTDLRLEADHNGTGEPDCAAPGDRLACDLGRAARGGQPAGVRESIRQHGRQADISQGAEQTGQVEAAGKNLPADRDG